MELCFRPSRGSEQLFLSMFQRGVFSTYRAQMAKKNIQRTKGTTSDPNWVGIAASIEQSKPHLRGQVLQLCEYVRLCSGGCENPIFLDDICCFAKQLRDDKRELSTTSLAAISKNFWNEGGLFLAMCVKASLVCPEGFLSKDREARLIMSADLSDLSSNWKKQQVVQQVQKLSVQVKEYFNGVERITRADADKLRGDLEVRAVMMTLNKKKTGRRVFKDLDEIKAQLHKELEARYTGITAQHPLPWASSGSGSVAASPPKSSGRDFKEFVQSSSASGGVSLAGRSVLQMGFKERRSRDRGRFPIGSTPPARVRFCRLRITPALAR